MPWFPQCNPSIRTHNAWQLEPGNSKQPGWDCDPAEGDLLTIYDATCWPRLTRSCEKRRVWFILQGGKEQERRREKPRWYYLLSKHFLRWSAKYTVFRDTHTCTHTCWTSRLWIVTWQPYIQNHTRVSGLFTVQNILTCKRAERRYWINKVKSTSCNWCQSVATPQHTWQVGISVCDEKVFRCSTRFLFNNLLSLYFASFFAFQLLKTERWNSSN